jgi:ABC-type transport system involved in multi-copper enzyme maturation permease subunit
VRDERLDDGWCAMSRDPRGSAVTRAVPSSLETMRLLAGMSLRRARRGRLLWLTTVILALPVLASVLALISGHGGTAFFEELLGVLLRYLTPFLMALHASATVAEEVQGKTITYLLSHPIARWTLPVGKYLGNLLFNAILLLVALVLIYLCSMIGERGGLTLELPRLATGLLAVLLAAVHFGAMATAFGTMVTSFPFVATLIYVLVVEVGFSFVPGWFKVTAMTVHLRAIAGLYHPKESIWLSDPHLSLAISLPVVLVLSAAWLIIAVGWVSSTEYRTDK